ncbi:hypothetical protein [Streptomyces sp. NBC_01353]|uniref:hypothetical protein n=1 Tax=Streptomyces sp. NBC_01353 TaxID=2903835 RepID=UPI002E33D51E|nr:hypothetical protein [Streptomyces sp. NBC_01353]
MLYAIGVGVCGVGFVHGAFPLLLCCLLGLLVCAAVAFRGLATDKVQWHKPTMSWLMTVSLSTEHKVRVAEREAELEAARAANRQLTRALNCRE